MVIWIISKIRFFKEKKKSSKSNKKSWKRIEKRKMGQITKSRRGEERKKEKITRTRIES